MTDLLNHNTTVEAAPMGHLADTDDYYEQTRHFYDVCADCYDDLYPDHVEASRKAAGAVSPVFHKFGVHRVLDASCGVGHDIENFSTHGFTVDGVDVSHRMLESARSRLTQLGLPNARLHHGSVLCLTKVTHRFDYDAVIFRGNTFSNLDYDDYIAAFREMSAVLRPGGLLYFDFREGEPHFRDARRFEFRGLRFDRHLRRLTLSWYWLRHGRTISETFEVHAFVYALRMAPLFIPRLERTRLLINSHYVPKSMVMEAMKHAGFAVYQEVDVISLPYLLSYVSVRER